jgi:hypothetical protein
MMRGWQRKIWRWRIIYSRGWIRPGYGVRLLIIWGAKPYRYMAGSLAIVNDRKWQATEQQRQEEGADNLRVLRAM